MRRSFQLLADVNSVFWKQTLGSIANEETNIRRRRRKHQVASGEAMKNISLSAHKNNVVWCSKCPELCQNKPEAPVGSGSKDTRVKGAMCMRTEKGKGSDNQRFV